MNIALLKRKRFKADLQNALICMLVDMCACRAGWQ